MASGGGSSGQGSLSEHRKRIKAYRVDNDDISSLGSNRQEDRPNNWVTELFYFLPRFIPLKLLVFPKGKLNC